MLGPRPALSVAMILHELATNATKYGALSDDAGRVELFSERTAEGAVRIVWRECDGPAVTAPTGEGFGMQLVRNETSYNLRGEASVAFEASGVAVTLRFRDQDDAGAADSGGR